MLTLALALILVGCEVVEEPLIDAGKPSVEEPVEKVAGQYDNGRYRGTYADRGVEQVGVQFDIEDNVFTNISFRQLFYGADVRQMGEGEPMYAVKQQFEQVAEYLVGKPIEAIYDLYTPGEFVADIDGFTGATLRANKMASAIKDGLNRGVYSNASGISKDIGNYDNGRYRGVYYDRGVEQVGIQFDIEDNVFTNISFRQIYYGNTDFRQIEEDNPMYGVKQQFEQIAEYLVGKPLEAIYDLHTPGEFVADVDGFTGATVRANKVFSAINNGLSRGVYSNASDLSKDIGSYEDGRYRGIYADRGTEQVGVQFDIEDNVFTSISFRQLFYGADVRQMGEGEPMYAVKQQFEQVADYLVGKPIEAIYDLHTPGDFVADIDGFTGATLRANKLFSAIKDGLNRGVYSY